MATRVLLMLPSILCVIASWVNLRRARRVLTAAKAMHDAALDLVALIAPTVEPISFTEAMRHRKATPDDNDT